MNITKTILSTAFLLAFAQTGWAAVTTAEAEHLGKDLTPMGAETAGNKDGTIPAWDGGLNKAPPGWKPEQGYVDPFPNEKPLLTITAQNYEQYKEKLSVGAIAMFRKYPNYRMPVYTTHRTFAQPQEIYKAVKENATKVKLAGEYTLENYTQLAIPFPIPKNGVEAMYNHLLRWTGSFKWCANWLPVLPNGQYYKVGYCQESLQASNMDKPQPGDLNYYIGYYTAPSSLLGTMYLVKDPIDASVRERAAWIYNSGQRRVRRAPTVAYDNVDDGTEGMRITDDWNGGFNGALDRYDWKLVGKKEMYIPYNAYKLSDPRLKYADMLDKGFIKPDLMRYELHRVWTVEATLKKNKSHLYARRVFYIDEDSWGISQSDAYDGRGNLWRYYSEPQVQAYDVPNMFQRPYLVHDLINGNLFVGQIDNEIKQPAITFGHKGRVADFDADALRQRGTR